MGGVEIYKSSLLSSSNLEPIYFNSGKKSTWPLTGFGNREPLKVLNSTKLVLDAEGNEKPALTHKPEQLEGGKYKSLKKSIFNTTVVWKKYRKFRF